MSEPEYQRRPSYGPTSPVVGSRGARTRAQIAEAALRCFTTQGYHATSVDEIAGVAETSRATLYQYFESKEAIFAELMVKSGTALRKALDELGRLGADADGYANLREWLRKSWTVYDTFAPTFIEWTNVNASKAPLRDEVAAYIAFHVRSFSARLTAPDFADDDPATASLLVLALFSRYNYIRHVYRPGPTDTELFDGLACGLQRYLFPGTPDAVLIGVAAAPSDGAPEPPPVTHIGPLATLPPPGTFARHDAFAGVSEQAAGTVRQLLDAAGRVFAAHGYRGANIDHVVHEAGLARGTFYRYFSDKSQLMIALSDEAAAAMCPLFDELAELGPGPDPARLRDWLARFLAVQRRYSGVMRAWTEGLHIDPVLLAGAADAVAAMTRAAATIFGPPRPYPLIHRAGGLLLSSLLEYFPSQSTGADETPTDAEIVEVQACFIERVLLPG